MDPPDSEDSFLTVADVAEMLKLNQQTVRNWIDQGSLPAVRVGRRVRIKRSDFERVLAEGYTGVGGSAAQNVGPTPEDFWGGEAVGLAEPVSPPGQPAPAARESPHITGESGAAGSDAQSATDGAASAFRATAGDQSQGGPGGDHSHMPLAGDQVPGNDPHRTGT